MTINCRGRLLLLNEPLVMGIINITPDSFYAGSRQPFAEGAVETASRMIGEGAAIIDIGGQSTRPGSSAIGIQEEVDRILPVIEAIKKKHPDAIISADTFYSKVAEAAVVAGASIINDVSGGTIDENMLSVAARLKTPYICMHIKGTPETMQQHAVYADVIKEVLEYFINRLALCREAGINDVIIDPGFGFAKTAAHNFTLLNSLGIFKMPGTPLLAGISRKSFIYRTLGITAEEALNGTTVLNTIALLNGAAILRVHDVKAAAEAIKLVKACKKAATG
ncbi:MAG TPA: dihydropteroate synthase [Chitinophagaceae bacterium]|nr:dihydropteroate synthase [Chitinophagaceae bacterium]